MLKNINVIKFLDISKLNSANFSYEIADQFSKLLNSNSNMQFIGDFYCIKVFGRVDSQKIQQIENALALYADKKVFLDFSKATLVWNDESNKYKVLPQMFLYNKQNVYWLSLGHISYIPENMCRDCKNLRYIHFDSKPKRLGQMAFYGIQPFAVCIMPDGRMCSVEEFEKLINEL